MDVRVAVYRAVASRGAVTVVKICRIVNNVPPDDVEYCVKNRCRYYLNPRRRAKLGARKPPCKYPLYVVRRVVSRFERKGIFETRKVKLPDHREERGYDYFRLVTLRGVKVEGILSY